ncbi:EF-hand domain-containing protein [Coralloluteibacterium stylophorae]|uniref:EF-hand domain-containing protein n=1 Tax=Coralloluteibacterium stylophorae TaxID=1776034 RepID=A0A8J7VV62_9GAMM|nr:EF-hand domain-containing protein [Coralloluteibacterium stylophorae]MBS7456476.1 EF-hand domain-containing protein [Coralloluteibacterium stylophorae]
MTIRIHITPVAIGLAALGVAALLATSAAAAQSGDARQQRLQALQERMAAADTDGDGAYSRAEVEAGFPRMAEHFDQADTDGDGLLTREELRALAQAAGRRMR